MKPFVTLYLGVLVACFTTTALAANAHGNGGSGPTAQTQVAASAKGPTSTGQPNQSCQATPTTPGNAAKAPGSAFNTAGTAGSVYAGTQPNNTINIATFSQYDVACTHQK